MEHEIRRLALAVIALALQDAREKHRAVLTLFDSRETFDFWCHAAGMAPEALLERLPDEVSGDHRRQAA